jgi:glycosyltransferase involved in cell wall biosynthesis
MNHLHFVQSTEPLQGGGLGQAALGLHLAMRHLGRSRLVATAGETTLQAEMDISLYRRNGPAALYFSSSLMAASKELVGEAEWVHGHGFYVGTNAMLGREAVRQGKPLCYHPHGFLDPWILRRAVFKKRLVRALFEDRNFRAVRLWRALTRKEADQIRAVGMKQRVEILPNGIRLEEIDQAVPESVAAGIPSPRRGKRMLFLGRIHPKKGLDLLIGAWARLVAEFTDWEVLIVGPDEGGYLSAVKEMVRQAGLEESVRFHGSVSGAAKAAAFRSADLFVLPSYSEGFPMAVIEAAAHRLPCAVTSECNFPELAAAGAGWECAVSVDSFTACLGQALAADDAERQQRGALGRVLIEEKYTWPHIARELHAICQSMS